MTIVYIGLGSNLQGPEEQLRMALRQLDHVPAMTVLKTSSFYQSQPWGGVAQADFVNAVVGVETALKPLCLLDALQTIEKAQGRDQSEQRWGPRTLDLDILFYGDLEIDTPELRVPHPRLKERDFVIYPLMEIAPQYVMPDGTRIAELKLRCPLRSLKRLATQPVEVS